tara:strand:- start:13052 stop:13522 length:471 start_codon:yes stop_codon:yes gene_type:complete
MRRILPALAGLVFASSAAMAGPGTDLAEAARSIADEAQQRAQFAAERPGAPAAMIELDDPLQFDLDRFSADAMRLSRAIDAAGGPIDLRCIFRGMSGDAASRLEALNEAETAADQARIYREISALMHDAAEIAPAADGEDLPVSSGPPGTCPATHD